MIEITILERAQDTTQINFGQLFTAISALLSALFIWMVKLSFENFQKESLALNEVQILLAVDAEKIKDNEEFFDSWISSLQKGHLYAVQFHSLIFPYEKLKDIKSSQLINQIATSFYMCDSFGKDLAGMHKSYYDTATSGVFKKIDEENWLEFNKNTLKNISESKVNFTTIKEKILKDIDDIKKYITIRKKSIRYKIISILEGSMVSRFEKQNKKTEDRSET